MKTDKQYQKDLDAETTWTFCLAKHEAAYDAAIARGESPEAAIAAALAVGDDNEE